MSATDELLRLLDERGTENYDYGTEVWWGGESSGGGGAKYTAYEQTDGLICVEMADLTPEQAIAATLDAGTCKLDGYTDAAFRVVQAPDETDFIDYAEVCECTVCGASVIVPHEYERVSCGRDELWPTYNYCPHCGAKVVGE